MKAATFFSAFLLFLPQSARAQATFDGSGLDSPEYDQWKRTIAAQIRDHSSFLSVGRGKVTINFCIDSAGRVVNAEVVQARNNEQALIALSTISSLRLPPPPAAARAAAGGKCHYFQQNFYY
jgi:hypothetical protein